MKETFYVAGNFVSSRRPDFESSGSVLALESSITFPLPTIQVTPLATVQLTPSPSTALSKTTYFQLTATAITIVAVMLAILTISAIVFIFRNRLWKSTHCK